MLKLCYDIFAGPPLSGKYGERKKNREKFYLAGHLDEKYENAAISR